MSSSQNTNSKWNVSVEQNIPDRSADSKPADQSRSRASERKETDNFELSSKTTTTVSDGYRIEYIAVAVVVNRKPLLAAAGDKPGAVDEQIKVHRTARLFRGWVAACRAETRRRWSPSILRAATIWSRVLTPITFWDQDCRQTGNYLIATAILVSTILFIPVGLRPSLRLILDARKPALPAPEKAAEATLVRVAANALPPASQIAQPTITAPPGPKKPSPLKQAEQAIQNNEEQAAEILKLWINEG